MPSESTDLKIDVQEPEAWSRRLSIVVPAERVKRTRGAVTSQIARNARMPGFRKGKLPDRVVEQRFGPSIEQETLDRLIQETYREALQNRGFSPITQGKVENVQYDRDAGLAFDVEFEVQPQIELPRVSGFTLSRPPEQVGDEEVDNVLERLRDDRAAWEPLEEGAKPDFGDQVVVAVTACDAEGNPLEGEDDRAYRFVLGEGQAIPDVEEAIRTLAPGSEGLFTVRFPDDFPDEARRGEEQRLRVVLNEANRKVLPELDDEFARSVGDFESVEALRARVLEDLRGDARQRADADVRRQLIDGIVEANPFSLPRSMVERYLDYMTGHSHEGEHQHHHTPEEEARLQQVRDTLRPQAEWGMKRMLIVEQLADREGLRATQDEIDERVEGLAQKHGRTASEVWIQLEKQGQLEVLEREITEDKVFAYLLEQNTVA